MAKLHMIVDGEGRTAEEAIAHMDQRAQRVGVPMKRSSDSAIRVRVRNQVDGAASGRPPVVVTGTFYGEAIENIGGQE